jgi:hypothetical protein
MPNVANLGNRTNTANAPKVTLPDAIKKLLACRNGDFKAWCFNQMTEVTEPPI